MPSLPTLFTFDWDAPVSDEDRERLFDKIIWAARRWRMGLPLTLFLESTGPLSHLAGQAAIVGSPLLAALLPGGLTDVQRLSKLLEDPNNVQRLIDRISQEGDGDAARF